MRRDSLLLLGLLTTIGMIAGVVIGIGTGTIAIGAAQASPTAPRASPVSPTALPSALLPAPNLQPTVSTQQMALLVIGVADKNVAQPKFEGAWIIAFSPNINKYYLVGVPPEAHFRINGQGAAVPLADIYAQGVQQDLGYLFVRDAIQSVYTGMAIQAGVTLDRSDLANLTTNLGGVAVGSQFLVGADLTAAYDSETLNGPAARMAFQSLALQALIQGLAAQHWTPASVSVYLQQLPHAVRAEDAAALTALAASAPSLQDSELIWTVAGGIHDAEAVP